MMITQPLTIYLIRHGVTLWNKTGLCMGQTDIPLDEEGQAQARRLAAHFSTRALDLIASIKVHNASITTLLFEGNRWRILDVNQTLDPLPSQIPGV